MTISFKDFPLSWIKKEEYFHKFSNNELPNSEKNYQGYAEWNSQSETKTSNL